MTKTPTALGSMRLRRRILRHHLPLALVSGIAMLLIGILVDGHHDSLTRRLTVGSAFVGTALVAATLLIGPLNILRARPNPISADLRRDIGIWAGIISLLHVVAGFRSHGDTMPWEFFIDADGRIPLRLDAWGQANWLGLAATMILVLLLALSNDRALRGLGTGRWKALQRSNYGLLALIAVHGWIYIPGEDRSIAYSIVLGLIVLVVISIQIAGMIQRQKIQATKRATA
ncbi:MAG: hypothetical protein Fur005_36390 [Roseiflexaceae bacterium]